MTSHGGQEQLTTPAQKVVCDPCRKSRRKCDRNNPCGNCSRRAISCTHESPAVESRARPRLSPLASLPYILPRAAPPNRLCSSERAPSQNNDEISRALEQHICDGAPLLSQPRGMCHTINWCRPITSLSDCATRPNKEAKAIGVGNLEMQIDAKTAVAVLRRNSTESANPNRNISVSYTTDRVSDKQTDNLCARICKHINLGELRLALELVGTALQDGTDGEVRQHLRDDASRGSPTTEDLPDKNDSDGNDLGHFMSLGKLYKKLAFFVGDHPRQEGYGAPPAPFDHELEKNETDIDLEEAMQRLTTIDHETEEGVIQLLWLGMRLGNLNGTGVGHDAATGLKQSARISRLERELYLNVASLVVWCRLSCAEDRKAFNEATVLRSTIEPSASYKHLADCCIHKHALLALEAFHQLCELDLAGTVHDGLRIHTALCAAVHLAMGQKDGHSTEIASDDVLHKFSEHLAALEHAAPERTISAEALAMFDKLRQRSSADLRNTRCTPPAARPSRLLGGDNVSRKRKLDQLPSQPEPLSMSPEKEIIRTKSDISPYSGGSTSQLRAADEFTSEPDALASGEVSLSVPLSVHQHAAETSSSCMAVNADRNHKTQPLRTQAPVTIQPSVSYVTPSRQSSYIMQPSNAEPAHAMSQHSYIGGPPGALKQPTNNTNLILPSQASPIKTRLDKVPDTAPWDATGSLTYCQPHLTTDYRLPVTDRVYPTANGQTRASHYWSPHGYSNVLKVPYQQYSSGFDPASQFYNNQLYPSAWPYFTPYDTTPSKPV